MELPFIKMQGLGNDYVYVDCFVQTTAEMIATLDLPLLARKVSDRHYGIGSDGLVLIERSEKADARMQIFNADGSEALMCGNASRCIGKYLYEHNVCRKPEIRLETLSGIKTLLLDTDGEHVRQVTVDMGTTIGNPHKVIICRQPIEELTMPAPTDTNVEYVNVLNEHEIKMRVCERGSGETLACGTGACAAATHAMDSRLTGNEVVVHMPGGDLLIRRDAEGVIYMTGGAEEIFSGQYTI